MAKFLNKDTAVAELKSLIRNGEHTVILISPYLKLSNDFQELLEYRNNKSRITTIIFRESQLKSNEENFFKTLRWVELKCMPNLHTKCYMNDSKMIITSLNLYDTSMANNKEMGVLIDKNEDTDTKLFDEAYEEVNYIIDRSKKFEFESNVKNTDQLVKSVEKESRPKKQSGFFVELNKKGYCIRTGSEIPFNVEKPMSYDAFKAWSKYADPDYEEKFCHFSGEPSNGETSVSRPILKKNWKKAKEAFDL